MTRKMFDRSRAHGMALPVVLTLLSVTMLLGAAALRGIHRQRLIALQARDRAIAFSAAEAALRDAERDIQHGTRNHLFDRHSPNAASPFTPGLCHRSGEQLGLCQGLPDASHIWLSAGLDDASAQSAGVPYGTFTGHAWPQGGAHDAPAPRYVIEVLPEIKTGSRATRQKPETILLYRITAAGFGANGEAGVHLQAIYRKASSGGDKTVSGVPSGRLSWREIVAWEEMQAQVHTHAYVERTAP